MMSAFFTTICRSIFAARAVAVAALIAASAPRGGSSGATAGPGDWPQFRGPGARGVSEETGLPDEWSTDRNVAWKTAIPGRGWSCPIVWGDAIFLTTAVSSGQEEDAKKGLYFGGDRPSPSPHSHRWEVISLDANSGKVRWQAAVHEGKPDDSRHIKNSHASETPVTDGERIYALFGNLGVYALTLDGKPAWSKRLDARKTRNGWGTAASPALHKGRLYIVKDNEESSYLLALDAKTGNEVWRIDRDEKSNWATPYIWENGSRTEIVTAGSGRVRSYDLDGKLLWQLKGMSSITIPTPYAEHGLLYVSSGYVMDPQKPAYAIRPGASGDISLAKDATQGEFIAWCQPKGAPYNPSTLVYGPLLYVLLDRGLLSCYDAKTGAPLYQQKRLADTAQAFTASPWAYEGKIFCLSEDGDAFVVRAGPSFELLGKSSLGEMCMATPAISRGALYIRTLTSLYKIAKPKA
jgi:outer membrane protein assembly factor BamB